MSYKVHKEYTDIISGKTKKRPGFDSLFTDAHKRKFDIVLFWDISRFSRSGALFTLQKLKELDDLKIKWHSYNDPYFSSLGQFKDVVLSLMATIAKMEREKISERTKAGLERAKSQGRFPGRPKKNPKVYDHYCAFPGCRIKVQFGIKFCKKHKKFSISSQKKGGRDFTDF